MRVDLGNALASEATPGVPRAALDRLDGRVTRAHERIERGRREGALGYAALDLPHRTDPTAIEEAVAPLAGAAHVLVVGIGGSALGAATVASALGDGSIHTLDNVDPAHTARLLDSLPLADTVLTVVSRSGTTAETLANFLVVREAMAAEGLDWTERTLVVTGESGPLRELAGEHALPALDVPAEVPGRFGALSTVGLVPAAIRGHDIGRVLDGGRRVAEGLSGSLYETPAYAYGAACYALDARGASVNAMMPYAEALEPFAEWFAQLWAESLGKEGLGQTPARALGATDQHSQLQLYRAGPRDKLVTLVRPRERSELPIPAPDHSGTGERAGNASATGEDAPATGEGALASLRGTDLGTLLDAEFQATEASLAAADRPSVRIEVDRLDASGIGELCYGLEAACVLAGELYGVETFTQPAVEWGKCAARGLLGGGDGENGTTSEARAVGERTELVVE
ncbi:glucose-6-phosphate isomerase [Halobacteriales archaeon QS_4_69_34]|nr:MAG: glucose-6-phosphate isomerase [Halobacteriales archaeon QS_4_69_34]